MKPCSNAEHKRPARDGRRRRLVLARAAVQDSRMQNREQRIVDTAVELARDGGFKAVRMREVAAKSGCALATLYRHFPKKDDLVVAALSQEARSLERRMRRQPPRGETALERITAHFAAATQTLFRRPDLAAEILRAAASDDPELWEKVRAFHGIAGDLVIAALRGDPGSTLEEASALEQTVCQVLQQVWFAALFGRLRGQFGDSEVSLRVRRAAELVLRGADLDD